MNFARYKIIYSVAIVSAVAGTSFVLTGCGKKNAAGPGASSTTTTATAPAATGTAASSTTGAPASSAPGTVGTTGPGSSAPAVGAGGVAPPAATGTAASTQPVPPGMKGMKVACLLTGTHSDHGWNEAAWNGLLAIQADGGQIQSIDSLKAAQFAEQYRYLAKSGYKLIFGHGDEFGPAAAKVAAQFPKVVFVTTGGDKSGPNLIPIHFATEEGSYLQGMEAAMLSKSGKGGFVGGQEFPPVKIAADAFGKGARSINPKFDFKIAYINGWSDQTAAKAQTMAFLNNGVDVIAHNCDAAAKGMFDAAAAKPGVYSFGVNADENGKAPNVLSSVYLDVPKTFEDIARDVAAGTVKPGPMFIGLKSGKIRLIDNPKLAGVITAANRAKIDQAAKDIADGKIKVTGP